MCLRARATDRLFFSVDRPSVLARGCSEITSGAAIALRVQPLPWPIYRTRHYVIGMRSIQSILIAAVSILLNAGCSSSSTPPSSSSAPPSTPGPSSSDAASGGSDAGQGEPGACEAQIKFMQRCGESLQGKSQACADGRRQTCDKRLATMSPAYQSAIAACTTDATDCNDGPSACVEQHMSGVAPTAAQTKVRDDFCATCKRIDSCADAFFKIDPDNGDGPGFLVLVASDAVAQTIDAKCTGAALDLDAGGGDCLAAFSDCLSAQTSSALPDDPDACFPPAPDGG
jgi:hypothetical protein